MKVTAPLSVRQPLWATVGTLLLILALASSSRAQLTTAQLPASPAALNTPGPLPAGVDRIYALEGTNTLFTLATPEGYENLRELIRNLDGDLDILQTKVVSVEANARDLAASGASVKPGSITVSTSVSPTDAAKLLAALQNGALRATETLRITTRENTPVDTLLRARGARNAAGGTPFTLVPRENRDGSVSLEILQPVSVQVNVPSGGTSVVLLPSPASDTVRLLFLTPSVLSGDTRRLH